MASDGAIANGGFATSEPYIAENELPGKKYPNTDLQLINDTGYPMYGQALTIRPADKEKLAPCLKKLVPILQQATVDFITKPEATNELVIKTVETYKDFWQYSTGMADYAVKTHEGPRPDRQRAEQDPRRHADRAGQADDRHPHPDLRRAAQAGEGRTSRPSELFTNEYINPGIGLTSQ